MDINKDKVENDIFSLIGMQQSERQISKSLGFKPILSGVDKYRGTCSLCKNDTWIVRRKEVICNLCYQWCKRWIIKHYGVYSKSKLGEAMANFLKPQECRFFSICGNHINMVENGKVRRSSGNICDNCIKIFTAGYKLGVATKKRHFNKGQGAPLHDRFK